MAGMFDYSPGLAALNSGLDSIGNVLDTYRKQQDQQRLAAAIQSGDLTGAAQSAFAAGNPYVGLQLYSLAQKKEAATGLGQDLENIQKMGAPATVSPDKVSMAAPGDAMAYAPAIDGGETSATDPSAYSRLGIVIPKTGDRAYGKHQVMGANIGPWTQEALGTAMTPEQFLASPEAQDAVFKHKFGQYIAKYGPEGAAKAWFAGEGGMNNPNAADPLGTTVASYASGFNRRLGQPPALAAIDAATGGVAPDGTAITLAAGKRPSPASPDGTEEPSGPRPLGKPPAISDNSDEVNALMAKRDAYIRLLPKAELAGQTVAVNASIKALEDQIKTARDKTTAWETEQNKRIQRAADAENILGYKRGSPEWREFIVTGNKAEETPHTTTIKDQYGNDITARWDKETKQYVPIKLPGQGTDNANAQYVPPGVDPKKYLQDRANATVKAQEASGESKKTWEQTKPIIDEAIDAYEELNKNGGIGQMRSSGPARALGAALSDPNEIARQRYELALARLNLVVGRAQLKGQGAVSDFERKLITSQFPSLQAASGDFGLAALKKVKTDLENASHIIPTGYEKPGTQVINGYTIEQIN